MNSKLIFLCSSLLSLRFEKSKSSEFLGGGYVPHLYRSRVGHCPPLPPRRRHCKEKANKIQLMEHYILKQVLNKHLRYWGAGLKPKFLEYFKLDIQTIPTPSQYKRCPPLAKRFILIGFYFALISMATKSYKRWDQLMNSKSKSFPSERIDLRR